MNMLAAPTERSFGPGKRRVAHSRIDQEWLPEVDTEKRQPIFLLHLKPINHFLEIAPDQEGYAALAERNELPSDILRYEWRLYKAVLSTEWHLLEKAWSEFVTERTRQMVNELQGFYRSIVTPDMVVVVARLNDPTVRNFDRYTVLSRL